MSLRPYQVEIGRAVMDSVLNERGLTFSVEIARQGGKNELSAQMEVLLLAMFAAKGGNLVKGAPTFDPQVRISMTRLKERLGQAGLGGLWSAEAGGAVRLGRVRQLFLSAEPSSNVVGATAHVLIEMDEAQDVDRDKFSQGVPAHGRLHQRDHRAVRYALARRLAAGGGEAVQPGAGAAATA